MQCLCRALLHRIGDCQEPRWHSINRDQHNALPIPAQLFGIRGEWAWVDTEGCEKNQIAYRDPFSFDNAGDTFTSFGAEIRCHAEHQAALLGARNNGNSQWVLTPLFEAGGET